MAAARLASVKIAKNACPLFGPNDRYTDVRFVWFFDKYLELHHACTALSVTVVTRSMFPSPQTHHAADLEALFNACFGDTHHTLLKGGATEPFYAPAAGTRPAQIFYTQDYFRSALHEVAHWCVAGNERRQLPDYGYWYAPDGRDAEQQLAFEQVEVRPQALELIFCAACGIDFRVSVDNLNAGSQNSATFESAVYHAAISALHQGLPARALQWTLSLARFYRDSSCIEIGWIPAVFRGHSVSIMKQP